MELGANSVTADYGIVRGQSNVLTVGNDVYPFGVSVSISGYGVQNPSCAGEFDIYLGRGADPSNPEPYRRMTYMVFGLGPIVDGKYDYALVTNHLGELFVLARDVDRFQERYEAQVLRSV